MDGLDAVGQHKFVTTRGLRKTAPDLDEIRLDLLHAKPNPKGLIIVSVGRLFFLRSRGFASLRHLGVPLADVQLGGASETVTMAGVWEQLHGHVGQPADVGRLHCGRRDANENMARDLSLRSQSAGSPGIARLIAPAGYAPHSPGTRVATARS